MYSFESGSLLEGGAFENGQKVGTWTAYHENGRKRSVYQYLRGEPDGSFQVWDEQGQLLQEGVYQMGEKVFEKSHDSTGAGKPQDAGLVEVFPSFISPACEGLEGEDLKACSERKMLETIYQAIRYPAYARTNGIEGTAITRFVVEKDGSINEVQVLRGLCDPIAEECDRVVRLLDRWRPGIQNGESVRVLFHLPIRFRLE
jgi:TonB family protein